MIVWLIEDNQLHSVFFKLICKELNIDYEIFNSSKEVFEILKNISSERIPDAVFIDLVLEDGKRGEDLLTTLKSTFSKKNVKFIAFTADIIPQKNLKELGFDNVIYKPVNRNVLKKAIEELIDGLSNFKKSSQ